MSGRSRRADAAPSRFRPNPTVVAGSLFTAAVVLTAAVAAWPIYRSGSFVLLVVVSSVVAAGIAVVARLRRWSGWLVVCALAGAVLVFGVPLAVPARMGNPGDVAAGLGELAAGVAVAWKDLITVELPVGSYRNLLVPALIVFLVGTCAILLLSWLDGRRAYLATPVALAMISFGLFFGQASVSAPLVVGPIVLEAPVETALGVSGLVSCLLWLSWRAHDERMSALQRAAVSSGVRVSRHATPADRRRAGLGVGMIAVAVAAAVAVVPLAAQGADRDVLRTAIGPDLDLSRELSPLAEYRALFADDRAEDVLFSVGLSEDAPQRVRLATLTQYDGTVFRTGSDADADRFVRVPSALETGEGDPFELVVTVAGLSGLWMPTAGQLSSAEFLSPRRATLADGFYYSTEASAGVESHGLETGDSYRLTGVEPPAVDLGAITAPGAPPGVPAPESLTQWVEQHAEGADGAALEGLVTLLRDRGYVSHGLDDGVDGDAVWMRELSDYTFQPSASGHSLARMDALFTRLLEREADPRAAASGNYVAAIGDDEQFATAVALIARELGFPSRVVVGARLSSEDESLPICDEGLCRAQDIAAWAEVRSSDGDWVAVDATPQYAQSPSLEVTQQRDPEVVTEVRPDTVDEIVPPEPVQQDAVVSEPDEETAAVDLTWLGATLRIVGIVLLILLLALGPFAAVLLAKSRRRRSRRGAGRPAERIVGGWEEYLDAAVDARRDIPSAGTRSEIAAAIGTSSSAELARTADRAVFADGQGTVSDEDAAAYWSLVDADRRAILRDENAWRRLAAAVSLRSIVRPLTPVPGSRMHVSERGRRLGLRPARPTP